MVFSSPFPILPKSRLFSKKFILSFWNKDVSCILPLLDYGALDIPLVDEPSHASLVRDIYGFLDQCVFKTYFWGHNRQDVVEDVQFMDSYSISQDAIMEISKYQGHPNLYTTSYKSCLDKALYKGSSSSMIGTADLITLPGINKLLKKRVATMLETS